MAEQRFWNWWMASSFSCQWMAQRGPVAEDLEHGCDHQRPDDDGQRPGNNSDRDGPDNTES